MNNTETFRREAEARHVLKMPDDKREEYYEGVRFHRKQAGLDYLVAEVNRQRAIEAGNVLKLSGPERKKYYQDVLESRGKDSMNALIAAVKRQYQKTQKKELELEI